jgi:hypothetical protein
MTAEEIRWRRLEIAVDTMIEATKSVLGYVPGDQVRHGRLVALSDVKAAMCHIVAEEGKHG